MEGFILLKRNQRYLNFLNAIIELVIFFLSYILATHLRFNVLYNPYGNVYVNNVWGSYYIQAAITYAICMIIVYYFFHMYNRVRTSSVYKEISLVVLLNGFSIVFLTAFLYFTRITDFSRLTLSIFYAISTFVIIVKRLITRKLLGYVRKKGYNLKHVVVVGNGELAKQYIETIKGNSHYGFKIYGFVSNEEKEDFKPHLCNYDKLSKWLEKRNIDSVIIALDPNEGQYYETVIRACEKNGVRTSIIPFFHKHFPAHPTIDVIGKTKLINIRSTPLDDFVKASVKRIFDVIGSLILIILTSPIMLVAAVGVKLSSPGPIFYKQARVGKGKKTFNMYKFRSMKLNKEDGTAWSTNTDDRRTKFGSFIRKTSIDELPQFWNVLKGDMSLIGPRPEIPHFVDKFKEEIPMYMLKHLVRPGITGLAQVNGYRGDTSIEKRIEYDIWYIENWNFKLDIGILYKTIFGGLLNSEKIK